MMSPLATAYSAFPLANLLFGEGASTFAPKVDGVFDFIFWVSVAFFVLIIGLMVVFVGRYYARPGHKELPSPSHNNLLEAIWTFIPLLLVVVIFLLGAASYMDVRTPPTNAIDINVEGYKWAWEFTYRRPGLDGTVISNELHVPVDQPIRLIQSSRDVIHSLYVPDFRIKMDCVPGRYTYNWFEATKPGEYDLFCTEYCGNGHSNMISKVVVHESEADWNNWLLQQNTPPENPIEWGQQLYGRRGCSQCHSIDGTAKVGPSFKGAYGSKQLTSTGEVTVDENYIRESILNPNAKIRAGYQAAMPTFQGRLKDPQIDALIAFIKSLNEVAK